MGGEGWRTGGGGRGVENWRWEIVAELTYVLPGGLNWICPLPMEIILCFLLFLPLIFHNNWH